MSDIVRVSVIGYGLIGALHTRVIQMLPDVELVSVVDPNPASRERAKADWGCETFSDMEDMLQTDVDMVAVCTPPVLHRTAVELAARAKKHVIVEKPMASYLNEAKEMEAVCRREGVTLSVILQHRFDPYIRTIKRLLDEQRFGKPLLVNMQVLWYRDDEYYDVSPWRKTRENGGGVLMNQAIHYMDLMQHLLGPAKEVCGLCDTVGHQEMEVEDVGLALVRFENGALGVVGGSTVSYPGMHARLDIFCQNGSVSIVNDKVERYECKNGTIAELEGFISDGDTINASARPEDLNLDGHLEQYRDMVGAIREQREPVISGSEGLKVISLIEDIYASSDEKRWLRCNYVQRT